MSLAKGCVLCNQGAKMVLFVTGRCHRTCWYCPLSRERKGTDTVFANEHPVDIPAQIIQEAENMSALGTGYYRGRTAPLPRQGDGILPALKGPFRP